ncbi:hypothetical protein DPX16_16007 [Anabarilius grahami]|uniref:Uncharacterized protein n=1 Tax=Anabarilius grahami TaxID=495550 RepID=A0A3N0YUV7_ANAGA|nr:hypothetical protein DPX16_16007 [Anabarilius grahami]
MLLRFALASISKQETLDLLTCLRSYMLFSRLLRSHDSRDKSKLLVAGVVSVKLWDHSCMLSFCTLRVIFSCANGSVQSQDTWKVLQKKVSEVSAASESSMVYVSCRGALSDWGNVIEVVSLAADPVLKPPSSGPLPTAAARSYREGGRIEALAKNERVPGLVPARAWLPALESHT